MKKEARNERCLLLTGRGCGEVKKEELLDSIAAERDDGDSDRSNHGCDSVDEKCLHHVRLCPRLEKVGVFSSFLKSMLARCDR